MVLFSGGGCMVVDFVRLRERCLVSGRCGMTGIKIGKVKVQAFRGHTEHSKEKCAVPQNQCYEYYICRLKI
jgi:hypothetical protein